MNNGIRFVALVGAILLAAAVGFWSYQAGVAHGIEQSAKIVVPPAGAPSAGPYPYPYPYYYGWHRPWGFGFFFVPLFFFAFWLLVVRGLFWRRRAWYGYGGGCGPRGRFEEWHRQAHERAGDAPVTGAPGER
ncbi:MAG TPA: hypothetical protein VGP73_16555 [Thermoanaerobaculia bacterium]